MLKTISYSLEETKKFAKVVLDQLLQTRQEELKHENLKALILVLKGDLGSGKTAFTKCIGEILGIEDEITSPTFTIEKRYNITNDQENCCGIKTLVHIDAFRLESGSEISSIDFTETLKNSKNLICFEWPEMVSDTNVLPPNSPVVEFEFVDENTRKMSFSPSPNEILISDLDSSLV
ncbi:MAG: tRNA (adenosine(37)-N6)-threonylcarbamoyltransferase complex ATPase subunit type 1 TsaE [bacterium]